MRHDFKVGANYIDEPILGGDFTVGTTGQYTLTKDVQGSPVADITSRIEYPESSGGITASWQAAEKV